MCPVIIFPVVIFPMIMFPMIMFPMIMLPMIMLPMIMLPIKDDHISNDYISNDHISDNFISKVHQALRFPRAGTTRCDIYIYIYMKYPAGRYHQVRRMVAAGGNRVEGLHRAAVGPIRLDGLPEPGQWRWADTDEIRPLWG
jgi:hypothetical protein